VPSAIWIVAALPKNATGKIERASLAATFGHHPGGAGGNAP